MPRNFLDRAIARAACHNKHAGKINPEAITARQLSVSSKSSGANANAINGCR